MSKTKKVVRITKAHKLCFILSIHGDMTRIEAMRQLHRFDGKTNEFEPEANHDYWAPRRRYDGWLSPVARGLIKRVGKTSTGAFVFRVTPTGRRLAKALER